jgi:hypothetical protein
MEEGRTVGGVRSLCYLSRGMLSGAPLIKGTSQLPNPPLRIGVTMKKIIMKAWDVTITL